MAAKKDIIRKLEQKRGTEYSEVRETVDAAYKEAIAALPSNNDQGDWAEAEPVISKSNCTVVVGSRGHAKRSDIFAELRRRASAPKAFYPQVPGEYADVLENACRDKSGTVAPALEEAIAKIEAAYPGCGDDIVDVKSSSDVALDEHGYMKASAKPVPYAFRELAAASVAGLEMPYEYVGETLKREGARKGGMGLGDALNTGVFRGAYHSTEIEMPVIEGGKATFTYWEDHGFDTHTRWQSNWRKYTCESEDLAKAEAFIAVRGFADAYEKVSFHPKNHSPETWAFLPKEC